MLSQRDTKILNNMTQMIENCRADCYEQATTLKLGRIPAETQKWGAAERQESIDRIEQIIDELGDVADRLHTARKNLTEGKEISV